LIPTLRQGDFVPKKTSNRSWQMLSINNQGEKQGVVVIEIRPTDAPFI
jgi:hypothetical protein